MQLVQSLDFLRTLKENNNRDWMHANKPQYLEAKGEFAEFISALLPELVSFDEALSGLDIKKSIFRINRDIRFSHDKSPYKKNFGAFMVEGGKKSGNAGYYLHIEPGNNSFIAGGVYTVDSDRLSKIRQEIDYNPEQLKKVVEAPSFVKSFGALKGETLKRAPKGYTEDHPNIQLLKMKSFLVTHPVNDKTVLGDSFLKYAAKIFKDMSPMNEYLNVAMS